MFIFLNPNSCGISTGDCVVRALSIAMDKDWHEIYLDLCAIGYCMCDWGNSNRCWQEYLTYYGYECEAVPYNKNSRYAVRDFANEHPKGTFILATGAHVVTVKDGSYYDTWDSGSEIPVIYFHKPDGR